MKLHVYIDHDSQMNTFGFEVTRIMKLHRYIDHDSQMTPIDFQVTSSMVAQRCIDAVDNEHHAGTTVGC
ncbi:hypothetical protein DPMN_166388 [Dreissena polymorpha]|uniref:Uncharacterized protein n=1 Tax=Dreissena polymorpha TaxID=45954 RepID=A0A9D4IXU6_DREPO|nr:hypothetical protein DPMN_166388 [Dreissena polymorpha]